MAQRDRNGKFMKGVSANPSGRPKGSANKLTKELRAILKDIVYSELEQIPENLKNLPPKERIELLAKLLPYVLPKVEAVNYSFDEPWDLGI